MNSYLKAKEMIKPLQYNSQYGNIDLDPSIINLIMKDIPKEFDTTNNAIYIYITSCMNLNFSLNYFLLNNVLNSFNRFNPQEDISVLSDTFKDTVCFRTSLLLQILYKQYLDINSRIVSTRGVVNNPFDYLDAQYGNFHQALLFNTDEYVIKADASMTFLGASNDLYNAKTFSELTGLQCLNDDLEIVESFQRRVTEVYLYILKKYGKYSITLIAERDSAKFNSTDYFFKRFTLFQTDLKNLPYHNVEFISGITTLIKKYFPESSNEKPVIKLAIFIKNNTFEIDDLHKRHFELIPPIDWELYVIVNPKTNVYQEDGRLVYSVDKNNRKLTTIKEENLIKRIRRGELIAISDSYDFPVYDEFEEYDGMYPFYSHEDIALKLGSKI